MRIEERFLVSHTLLSTTVLFIKQITGRGMQKHSHPMTKFDGSRSEIFTFSSKNRGNMSPKHNILLHDEKNILQLPRAWRN